MPVHKIKKIGLIGLIVAFFCGGFLAGRWGAIYVFGPETAVLAADKDLDSDGDGLSDWLELTVYHTDPSEPDTDGDGYGDGIEVNGGFSPRHGEGKRLVDVDSDLDYLNDAWEIAIGTDLTDPDSDGDLYLDGTEVAAGYDPLDENPSTVSKKIQVDLKTQNLTYLFNGKTIESFPISAGLPSTPSPVGEFKILDKIPVKHYGGAGFSFPNTKWNLFFHNGGRYGWNYYIHGAYWHDNWGKPMSHGCINVDYDHMERLYWWAQTGTEVTIR